MIVHCLFEQSGTFKNEFKKLGYEAYDYDILNDFKETDYQIDLFNEIESAYRGGQSIFDKICKDDLIMAFFPCVRFEVQSLLLFRTDNFGMINWSIQKKLEYDLKLHNELHQLYEMITKLALICVNRQLPLIIENPYNTQHYLKNYWCLKPSIIDYNRNMSGDYYKKPTQYWFINCEPKQNIVFEAYTRPKTKAIEDESTVERSMISKEYANRFIREYIIGDLKIERKEQKNIFDLLENENDHIE